MVWHSRLRAKLRDNNEKLKSFSFLSHSFSPILCYFILQILFLIFFSVLFSSLFISVYLLHSFGSYGILLNILWCHIVSFILLQLIVQHFTTVSNYVAVWWKKTECWGEIKKRRKKQTIKRNEKTVFCADKLKIYFIWNGTTGSILEKKNIGNFFSCPQIRYTNWMYSVVRIK